MTIFKRLLTVTITTGLLFSLYPVDLSTKTFFSQRQVSAEELSKKEIVKKFYTNFSEAKSFNAKTDTTYTGEGENMIFKIESPTIKESKDFGMTGYIDLPVDNNDTIPMKGNFSIYKKNNAYYISLESITGDAWFKTTDSTPMDDITLFKDMSEYFELKELFKVYNDKISVTEKDGKYVISTKADTQTYKIFENKLLKFSGESTAPTQPYITDGDVTFTVDKESFNVESFDFSIKFKENNETYSIKSNSKFSDINKLSEIPLPEGAKYALTVDAEGLPSIIGS